MTYKAQSGITFLITCIDDHLGSKWLKSGFKCQRGVPINLCPHQRGERIQLEYILKCLLSSIHSVKLIIILLK